jgi:hypothetical protein
MTEPSSPVPPPEPALRGLTAVRNGNPERTPVRTRESGVTQSAWRLDVETGQGAGWIVRLDGSGTMYRGDGVFLGWSQEHLGAAWDVLRPVVAETEPEPPQLG